MSTFALTDLETRATEALRRVLPTGADIEREVTRRNESDSVRVVDLIVNGHEIELNWIGAGRLGDARRLLLAAKPNAGLIASARQMSPGARALLADNGVGWVDETGAGEIAVGSIVVSRTGRAPRTIEPSLRWTRSVLATTEALICDTPATVSAVQAATSLSSGSSTNALRTLTELGLLESNNNRGPASGRRVADLDALLAAYTTAANTLTERNELVVGALWRDPVEGVGRLGDLWSSQNLNSAATGAVASAVLAPFLTNVESALVYLDTTTMAGLDAAARAADLKPIEGGRLTLRPVPTVTTIRLSSSVNGLRCAPWPRVYADLQGVGVRGEEAAEHLREVMTNGR